jgi:hypothetical protein
MMKILLIFLLISVCLSRALQDGDDMLDHLVNIGRFEQNGVGRTGYEAVIEMFSLAADRFWPNFALAE